MNVLAKGMVIIVTQMLTVTTSMEHIIVLANLDIKVMD